MVGTLDKGSETRDWRIGTRDQEQVTRDSKIGIWASGIGNQEHEIGKIRTMRLILSISGLSIA